MRKEDQPPQLIWLDERALAEHFKALDEKYGQKRTDDEDDDSDIPADQAEDNALFAEFERQYEEANRRAKAAMR